MVDENTDLIVLDRCYSEDENKPLADTLLNALRDERCTIWVEGHIRNQLAEYDTNHNGIIDGANFPVLGFDNEYNGLIQALESGMRYDRETMRAIENGVEVTPTMIASILSHAAITDLRQDPVITDEEPASSLQAPSTPSSQTIPTLRDNGDRNTVIANR